MDDQGSERLICATCVVRLRGSKDFKKQILQSEEALFHMKMKDSVVEVTLVTGDDVKEALDDDASTGGCSPLAQSSNNSAEGTGRKDGVENACSEEEDDRPLIDKAMKSKTNNEKEKCSSSKSTLTEEMILKKKKQKKSTLSPEVRAAFLKRQSMIHAENRKKFLERQKRLQEQARSRDKSYMVVSNVSTIIENSYICPFRCRHNNIHCYYCKQPVADVDELRSHTAIHSTNEFKIGEQRTQIKIDITIINCRLCNAVINDLETFKHHITTVHEKKLYPNTLETFLPFRLTKNTLNCVLCDKTFMYFHALNVHMNEHYRNYVCETCGLGFVNETRLTMHKARHEVGIYPCDQCGKVFKTDNYREQHIDRIHRKVGRVYCPKCDVRLMSYYQKLKHLVQVHGEQPMNFPCTACEKQFESRRLLTLHIRKKHLKDFKHECEYCGQKFFTKVALKNHVPTHTGERNYKCKICEKSYPRLKTLKDHIRIHTNDRRYKCHICAQAFIQNCSLKGHMRTQHPEYAPMI